MFKNDEIIIKESNDGLKYIQFKTLLKYGIKHAYTMKTDGINYNFDSKSNLHDKSFEKICSEIGVKYEDVLEPRQTHTDHVMCVNKKLERDEMQDTDGLITDTKGLVLTTRNADCILFMFYDPVKNVIANVHSGWKGTFKKIAEKTVVKMINNYKCNPEDILCFVSPCIRKDHFEVDEDVKELCEGIFGFMDVNDFIEIGEIKDNKQKYMIDLVKINKNLFLQLGIKEKNIIDSDICSMCNSDVIHSARTDGLDGGRGIALISL